MNKVFISYSQDSEEHKKRVLALANRLRKEGVGCMLDRYVENPTGGWPKWMDQQLEEAQQVIIICTQTYCHRVMDKEPKGKGLGVKWESTLTSQYIYDEDSKNDKFIPVVFAEGDIQYIPKILKGVSRYCVADEAGYDRLYRRLTNQPEVIPPDIGTLKPHPPQEAPGLFPTPLPTPTAEVKVSISKLPVTGKDLFGREKELEILDKAWADPHSHMVTFVAWGGVGKSALVNYWLNLMAEKDYGGAKRVFGWSFYSQGAEAGKQASADEFMQTALAWFGDPDPTVGGAVEKARRLVELIRREPTLLVLDGLEPLQYPPGELHGFDGRLKDPGLKILVKELAVSMSQPGLCVITSREALSDVADKVGHSVKEVGLEHLGDEAGAQLLRSLEVTGADKELVQAVREYDGHALALTLLGNYLHSVFQGDIRKRDQVPGLTLERKKGWQAQRMMAAYEAWWEEAPEVNILRLLGLFDRPAPPGAIKAVTATPAIPGLTEKLQGLSGEEWQWAITNLREAGLMARAGAHKVGANILDSGATSITNATKAANHLDSIGPIDCHPLIREYFGAKMREETPEGWKEAHTRLYNYYKSVPEKELPNTLGEMEPLFAAVTHGCAAGLHQKALDEVYWPRINRRGEGYISRKLGASGAFLATVFNFFEKPWSKPAERLSDYWKAEVFNWAGYGLMALGRLYEAAQSMKTGLKMHIKQENWEEAAKAANYLSDMVLFLGQIKQAVDYATQAVIFADKSEDNFQRAINRFALGNALYHQGKLKKAEQWFLKAYELNKKIRPEYKLLFSKRGFRFCNLLLSLGKYQKVLKRAKNALKIAQIEGDLLRIALHTLSIGRAFLMKTLSERTGDFSKAEEYLHSAVEGLRKGSRSDHLPCALFARAECFRRQEKFEKAWQELNEAFEIAELGSMKLYIADYHLEAGRLCRAQNKENEAEEHFRAAKTLIEEMGYHRRDKEVI